VPSHSVFTLLPAGQRFSWCFGGCSTEQEEGGGGGGGGSLIINVNKINNLTLTYSKLFTT